MNSYDFLDLICGEVKYKSIHNAIRTELGEHIAETSEEYIKSGMDKTAAMEKAVSQMGDAKEIGKMFNKQYRLPFNSRFGLSIWAAVVTMVIYAAYPFLYYMWKSRAVKPPHSDFLIIGIILLFMAINVLYLRRGRKLVTVRDMAQVAVGFLIGYAVSAVILIGASYLTADIRYPYLRYMYMPEVRLPFAPPYIPMLPIDPNTFALQGFCWWLCIVVYVAAVKSRRKEGPIVIWQGISMTNGRMVFNFDEFVKGYDNEGNRIKDVGEAAFGWGFDKYGERISNKNTTKKGC